MLRDAARLARGDLRAPDVVEQRGLAVVDVAHDRDHRRTRLGFGFAGRRRSRSSRLGLGEQRLRIVQLRGDRVVAQFGDDDHRGVLIEHLVDRHHLAELHQHLDDLGGLDRHLVRELRDRDRLGHRDVAHGRLGRHHCRRAFGIVPSVLAVTLRAAPCAGSTGAVAAGLQRALLLLFLGPAGGELAALDFLDAGLLLVLLLAGLGIGPCHGFMQRASRGRLGCLGDDFLRRRHHVLDGGDFLLDRTARPLLGCGRFLGGMIGIALRLLGAREFRRRCRLARARCLDVLHLLVLRGDQFALRVLGPLARLLHLTRSEFRLASRFLFALGQFGGIDDRRRRRRGRLGFRSRFVTLDEDPLLADLDLDHACLARGIGLLDLGGLLAGQRDLLLLDRFTAAVGLAQRLQQARLVVVGERVALFLLDDPGRLQLLEQQLRRNSQFRRKLGHCCACHKFPVPVVALCRRATDPPTRTSARARP